MDTRFAYGDGRANQDLGPDGSSEYESINRTCGDTDSVSVGATWTFDADASMA